MLGAVGVEYDGADVRSTLPCAIKFADGVAVPGTEGLPAAALAIVLGFCFDAGDVGYVSAEGPEPANADSEGFFDQGIFMLGIFHPLLQPVVAIAETTNPRTMNRVHREISTRILSFP